jgi:hypothetical protein
MFRKFVLATAFAALAVPAFADTAVTVNVGGLDARAAHAVIYHAAQEACRAELADQSQLVQYYNHPGCLHSTIAKAEAKYAAMRGLASR